MILLLLFISCQRNKNVYSSDLLLKTEILKGKYPYTKSIKYSGIKNGKRYNIYIFSNFIEDKLVSMTIEGISPMDKGNLLKDEIYIYTNDTQEKIFFIKNVLKRIFEDYDVKDLNQMLIKIELFPEIWKESLNNLKGIRPCVDNNYFLKEIRNYLRTKKMMVLSIDFEDVYPITLNNKYFVIGCMDITIEYIRKQE